MSTETEKPGQEASLSSPTSTSPSPRKSQKAGTTTTRNAFSELMSSKPKKEPRQVRTSNPTNLNDPRNALLQYILRPESCPSNLIISYTEHSVLIRDAYPKSLLHLLLLPRDPSKYNLHPHAAFADANFLSLITSEVSNAMDLAASELSRILSPQSASCQARLDAMDSPNPPTELPPGRDFRSELRVGVHAHPSMNHLHIHIITPDMHSDSMKHRKHYNSFNTDFFIPFDEFALAQDDIRRQVLYQNDNLGKDFECWRCGETFGNKFKQLKAHLEEEFEAWKKD